MGGEVFNEIDAILNQYFNKVRKDMVQKFVTADRFIHHHGYLLAGAKSAN
jgi:hypothetical protein